MKKIILIGSVYPYKGGISHYTGMMCAALRKEHDVFKAEDTKYLI